MIVPMIGFIQKILLLEIIVHQSLLIIITISEHKLR